MYLRATTRGSGLLCGLIEMPNLPPKLEGAFAHGKKEYLTVRCVPGVPAEIEVVGRGQFWISPPRYARFRIVSEENQAQTLVI